MSKSTIAIAEDGLPRTESVFRQADAALAASRVPVQAAISRDTAFDYLRAFITVLVVAHHSVIAYARISPDVGLRHPLHPWLAGIPIADSHRLVSFDLFALFNDTFFMSLMFLLSGLFVWPSLARKGGARFLRDRLLRLGVPFVWQRFWRRSPTTLPIGPQRATQAPWRSGANGCHSGCGRPVLRGSFGCCSRSMASPPVSTASPQRL